MRIKKTLAMLLASTLIVTSTGIMSVNAADTSQGNEETSATGHTDLSLKVAGLGTGQGNSNTSAEGSTNLSLNIKGLGNGQGNENKNAAGSTKLTLVITDHEWSKPTYEWNTDKTKCTATRTCSAHEGEAAETETVEVKKTEKSATCTTDGSITYTATFTKDGFETQTQTETISATGHAYADPVFTWDGTTATAKHVCTKDKYEESLNCTVTSEVTKAATCTEDGTTVYTASVKIGNQTYTDTKTVTIKATGHKYGEPSFTWSDNNSKATATFTCANDKSHVENVACEVTSTRIEPTCETGGKITYTATAVFNGTTYTETTETPIAAIGHDYDNPVFTWSDDYKTATVKLTCKHDESHTFEAKCDVTETPETATCDKAGKVLFTATAIVGGKTYTDAKEVEVPALGHKYGNPVFTWSEDHKTATATRTCEYDSTHVETAGCKVTSSTVGATCTADGKTTYTATVKFGNETFEKTEEVVIPATGHKYGEPEFTWNADNTVTVNVTCTVDKHSETLDSKDITYSSETVDATCDKAGKTIYTATVKVGNKTYTDTKEVVIPAAGHKYGEPEFTWNDDNTATVKRTCTVDGKSETLEAEDVTYNTETVDATCDKEGKTIYTATVKVGDKTYTDTKEVKIPATGHQYGEPEFVWNADNTATVKVTCAVDKHSETIEAKDVTYKTETVEATCDKAGKATYTAMVKVGDKTYTDSKTVVIPATGHKWSDWKVTKEASATEEGKKESTCTVCGHKKYDVIPATGTPEEDPATGTFEKEVQVSQDAPLDEATMTNSKSEFLKADNIFNKKEKEKIEKGDVNAKVWLEISKTDESKIASDVKAKVESKAKEITGSDASNLTYFDADLFKQISDTDGNIITPKTAISEPGTAIDVTFKIPDAIRVTEIGSTARVYKLIRIHTNADGTVSVDEVDGTYNEETGEFSTSTDKFSTYAIAYRDVSVTVSFPQDDNADKPLTSVGEKRQLTVDITPASASTRQVKWTSSNPSVATVDENGIVTAVADGTATITATVGENGPTAEYTIKVAIAKVDPKPSGDKPSGNKPAAGDTSDPNGGNQPASQPIAPAAKADAKQSDVKKADTTKKNATKTGDNNTAWPFVVVMFAGVTLATFGRKKKENR